MSDVQPEAPLRSRFKNVINVRDVPVETYWRETGRYGASARELAVALGAKDLGYSITSVDPGRVSCPFHFHHSEEEVFYVLEGRGQLRQGDGKGEEELIDLLPGDCISFPAGTGIAHQFINHGDVPFVYLAMSNRIRSDVAEYPDSDKVNIRATRTILRRSPTLDYFDREL
jgi:uncharacterized cupin superfamily protein